MARLVKRNPYPRQRVDLGKVEPGVLDPNTKFGYNNYGWVRSSKNPRDLAEQVANENARIQSKRNTLSPLDEFKLYESTIYTGPDFDNDSDYFGIPFRGEGSKFNVAYPNLLDAYGKTKGKYAKSIDPEVQKYFNDRLAYRQGLYDRVNKIPEDKWNDFAYGYGPYSDPFDWEDTGEGPYSKQEFLDSLDNSVGDWDTLERYLAESGY